MFYQRGDLSNYLHSLETQMNEAIRNETEDYILNVNEEEYIHFNINQYTQKTLEIDVENAYADQKEEMIKAEHFPRTFFVHSGKSYPRMVVYFYIPVKGNTELLNYTPSTRIFWTEEMKLQNNELVYRVVQFSENVDDINRAFERLTSNLKTMEGYINEDVQQFNSSLRTKISSAFTSRKQELLKRKNLLTGLKVPLKKAENVSKTFTIPTPAIREKITVKPYVTEKGYTPEPTLDMNTYRAVLQIINDMGKEFERKPSVYSDKGEEQLRDHFLMLLEPNFDGSATGETFNKTGKTDILLRHEGNNVFVGECKFWTGIKGYTKTIDQLLGYLTWRDSKAAVVMFVRNKDFSSVLERVEHETSNHANFLGFVNKDDETWFNYRFHINGDRNREVKLAVMLYHIPTVQ